MDEAFRHGPLGPNCIHLCVDMQRMFAEDTDWKTPWMDRVLPQVTRLVAACPERTIFTRFVPARRAGEGRGTWKRYYEAWPQMTVEELGKDRVELLPDLARFATAANVVDKDVYSPWMSDALETLLRERGADTLIVSGGETDVCVLGTVLGAVDRGYRVIVATDALCSSSDEMHDASLAVYHQRYGQQVETVTTDMILGAWKSVCAA